MSSNRSSPLVVSILFMLGALALFTLHIFFVGPMVTGNKGAEVALFMISRVLIGVGLGFCLTWFAGRNRFQSVSSVMFIFLLDQVVLKGIWAVQDQKVHPELWGDLTRQELVTGLASGFMFFMPVILVLGFVGTELGIKLRGASPLPPSRNV